MSRQDIMLCYPFEESRLKKWANKTTSVIIQPKLDGERCRAIFDVIGRVHLLSSEGNQIVSVPHIIEQLEATGIHDMEIDGELYCHGMSFEDIHSMVGRTVNLHEARSVIEYHVFDVVSSDIQVHRLNKLLNTSLDFQPSIELVPSKVVSPTTEDIVRAYVDFIERGYEGIVIRHPFAPYLRKRSTWMMKFKPKKTDIYKIVGYQEEISIKGEAKGTLGALVLVGDDGTEFKVGSGFKQDERVELWKRKEELIGKYATVKYQHITSTGKVPRFPVFVEISDILSLFA